MTGPLPTLPVGPLDLLVKAALAPPDIAREAWRTWRRGYTLDETPWNEVRLLGAVAERIDWLEPDAEIVPRMKGIQKFLYAQTQLCLSGCTGGLKALAAAGIPMMLIKGAARVAADGRVARQRLVRDLDLLVPFADRFRAFATLWEAGWRFKANGAWQLAWHRMDSTANHHAWSLSSDAAEIDLHHFSNSLNRRTGDDDGLWRRARETQWRGLSLRLPDASDGLVLGIVHGLRWSQECNADWLIDVTASLDTGHVDWDLVVADAARREVQAILLHGLAYIRDVLRRDVPQPVLDHLAAGATGLQRDELAVYAAVPMPRDADQNAALLAMAVQRCGAPGEGQAPGASGVLELPAARLPAQTAVTVASFVPEGDAARLTIRMPASPGAQLVATLCIMGLVIDARTGVAAAGDAGGTFQAFHFSVPRQLVERRGAKRLCLTVTPAADPAYPPWRYRISNRFG